MEYEGVVFDLDGTVYRGGELLPGAAAAVQRVRDGGASVLFFSNNPTKSRSAYVERLSALGIDVDFEEVLSAGTVTTRFLAAEHADDPTFLVGSSGLREQLAAAGLALTDDPRAAAVLVASWDETFDYDDLKAGYRALASEAAFYGTDPDLLVPASEGRMVPGSGAIINAVGGVVGRTPDRILGKPSPEAQRAAEEALGCPADRCLLVGDRLDTDIALGERAGMTTALVRTGVATDDDLDGEISPDHVVDSLADLPGIV